MPAPSDRSAGPAVSVVVAARDAAATIGTTLAALAGQDLESPYEVIVVDDCSSDATAAIAERAGGPVRLVRRAQPEGPGPARNAGVAAAAAPLLAFTDADCVPAPDWLRTGLAALEDADLVQGAVRPVAGAVRTPFDRTVWVGHEYGLYETANLFITRDAFERAGGFEDWLGARIGKPLAEDVWLGWRIRRQGGRTTFSDEAVVEHAVFARTPGEFIAERVRLNYFPALVRKVPELRETFLHRRLFLNSRTEALDAAIVGTLLALVLTGSERARLAPLPLAASIPYAAIACRSARRWGWQRALGVLAVECAADAVGAGALAFGSIRWRSPVL